MEAQDWECTVKGCGNVNFARRLECNRCHAVRKDGGLPDPRGPPGLFSAKDWSCNMCGNVNWSHRDSCNICGTNKPGNNENEKRDGKGGGFNERQERVASSKREVGEDGYDDFGMKKKKGKASKEEREAAALKRLQGNYRAVIGNKEVALKEYKYQPDVTPVEKKVNAEEAKKEKRHWDRRKQTNRTLNKNARDQDRSLREEYRRDTRNRDQDRSLREEYRRDTRNRDQDRSLREEYRRDTRNRDQDRSLREDYRRNSRDRDRSPRKQHTRRNSRDRDRSPRKDVKRSRRDG